MHLHCKDAAAAAAGGRTGGAVALCSEFTPIDCDLCVRTQNCQSRLVVPAMCQQCAAVVRNMVYVNRPTNAHRHTHSETFRQKRVLRTAMGLR